ncbi:MAG: small multi-drug export protein [Candidatus Aenigmarchaeota archaeon]|nr:small multi-drug export protein [Candidatus Aenigmarchaeota archaeon]
MLNELLLVVITTMLPVSELRGGIPLGIALGLPPWLAILTAIIANCLVFFPVYFGLKIFYERLFSRWKISRKIVERSKKKAEPYINKYGILGLAVFIGVPLPATGVWTGTLIAWIMDLNWKKSFLAACLGVLIAAAIVSAIVLGFLAGLNFLV